MKLPPAEILWMKFSLPHDAFWCSEIKKMNNEMNIKAFNFKATCRKLCWRESSTCLTTRAWFFIETFTSRPEFPKRWHSTLPKPRNFVTRDNITVLLGAVLLNHSRNCSAATFLKLLSRPLPNEWKWYSTRNAFYSIARTISNNCTTHFVPFLRLGTCLIGTMSVDNS